MEFHTATSCTILSGQSSFLFFIPTGLFYPTLSLSSPLLHLSPLPTHASNPPPTPPPPTPFNCHSLPSLNALPFPPQQPTLHEWIDHLSISCYLPLLSPSSSPPQSVYPGGVVVVGLWGSWHPPSSLLPGGKNY